MSTEDNTSKAPDLTNVLNTVHGFLSLPEAELLYRLASEVPAGGNIVEIGSFQGRSTVCLGLGAKVNGARVYAIDPHEDMQTDEHTHYGMENHAALLKNLVAFEVADVVRVVALPSHRAHFAWGRYTEKEFINILPLIDLLWVDGSHEHKDVIDDIWCWKQSMTPDGKIAMHDSSGYYPGVTQALDEILAAGEWERVEMVDATSVLARVK